jgi:hypothetical protein
VIVVFGFRLKGKASGFNQKKRKPPSHTEQDSLKTSCLQIVVDLVQDGPVTHMKHQRPRQDAAKTHKSKNLYLALDTNGIRSTIHAMYYKTQPHSLARCLKKVGGLPLG